MPFFLWRQTQIKTVTCCATIKKLYCTTVQMCHTHKEYIENCSVTKPEFKKKKKIKCGAKQKKKTISIIYNRNTEKKLCFKLCTKSAEYSIWTFTTYTSTVFNLKEAKQTSQARNNLTVGERKKKEDQ